MNVMARGLIASVALATLASQQAEAQNREQTDFSVRVQQRVSRAMARFIPPQDTFKLKSFPFIIGGTPAADSENPYQVALLDSRYADDARAQYCGGSLITATLVITAAHCSDFVQPSDVRVLVGSRILGRSGQRYRVSKIDVHPSWDSTTMDFDVALWRIETPAAGATASLETRDLPQGTRALVTGWGRIAERGPTSRTLLRVAVPLVPLSDCNDGNSYAGAITSRMLCAGETNGAKDSCQGDSGGPMSIDGRLVGITSWGRGCGRPNLFGVYTRIADHGIRDFIERVAVQAGQPLRF